MHTTPHGSDLLYPFPSLFSSVFSCPSSHTFSLLSSSLLLSSHPPSLLLSSFLLSRTLEEDESYVDDVTGSSVCMPMFVPVGQWWGIAQATTTWTW